MAYGNVVLLGWRWPKAQKVLKELGVDLQECCGYKFDEKTPDGFGGGLREAHIEALKEMGFTFVRPKQEYGYDVWLTPLGERQFASFCAEFVYDPDEMGDEPQDAVFGVSLSSRYFPTFLDWQDSHGGLEVIEFDQELLDQIEIARKHIMKVWPQFRDAGVLVKMLHY
jgi:hypothetical protein